MKRVSVEFYTAELEQLFGSLRNAEVERLVLQLAEDMERQGHVFGVPPSSMRAVISENGVRLLVRFLLGVYQPERYGMLIYAVRVLSEEEEGQE